MAIQLGLSRAHEYGLELRGGMDRRRGERRASGREGPERRRGERRGRRTLRNLLLTSLAIALPHQPHLAPSNPRTTAPSHLRTVALSHLITVQPLLRADVTTSIDSFVAVPPFKAYEDVIQEAAVVHDVDPRLIRSVMQMESAFNPFAVSRAGALGLMQLMPELATELDVADPFDPRENIMAGTQYLRRLLDQYNGNITLTLASYNAGATNVARYGGVPPFEETQNYVVGVRNLLRRR